MPKKNSSKIKITEAERTQFPYEQFPVKIIHMEGKEMKDKKICYFQNEHYANKYIVRCKFKKGDYEIYIKKPKE